MKGDIFKLLGDLGSQASLEVPYALATPSPRGWDAVSELSPLSSRLFLELHLMRHVLSELPLSWLFPATQMTKILRAAHSSNHIPTPEPLVKEKKK